MTSQTAVLRSAGTSLVYEIPDEGLPRVLHWGADLPDDVASELATSRGP